MKLLNLYNRKVSISYKHSFCSFAFLFVTILTVFTIVMPLYIVFSINHDLWFSQYQNKIVYEQPSINFQYKYILLAEHTPIITDTVSNIAEDEYIEETTSGNIISSTNNNRPTKLVAWSSYEYFNQLMENWHKSVSIKVKFPVKNFNLKLLLTLNCQ